MTWPAPTAISRPRSDGPLDAVALGTPHFSLC